MFTAILSQIKICMSVLTGLFVLYWGGPFNIGGRLLFIMLYLQIVLNIIYFIMFFITFDNLKKNTLEGNMYNVKNMLKMYSCEFSTVIISMHVHKFKKMSSNLSVL